MTFLFERILPRLEAHLVAGKLLAPGKHLLCPEISDGDAFLPLLLYLLLELPLERSLIKVVRAVEESEAEYLLHRPLTSLHDLVIALLTAAIIIKKNVLRSLHLLGVLAVIKI